MVALTGLTPANTYKDLLQVSNSNSGIDATLRDISDGEGTAGPFQISTGGMTMKAGKFLNTIVPTDISDFSAAGAYFGTAAAANLLDDYEEGTWTPALVGAAGSGTITYSNQTGSYTKVGNLVTCKGRIDATSVASRTGNTTISGLPFTVGAGADVAVGIVSFGSGLAITAGTNLTLVTSASSTSMTLYTWDSTAGTTIIQIDTEFTDDGGIRFQISYFV